MRGDSDHLLEEPAIASDQVTTPSLGVNCANSLMNLRLFAASSGAWLLLATSSPAIPQTFNTGGGFVLRAGMRFEEFAADKSTWSSGSLKGDWSELKGGEQTLKDDAVVFGIPAAEIKAERTSEGVQRFRVLFRSDAAKHGQAPLVERVMQNVRAFTGDAGKADGSLNAKTFRHKDGVQITVQNKSAREVEVEFRPGS